MALTMERDGHESHFKIGIARDANSTTPHTFYGLNTFRAVTAATARLVSG